MIYFFITLFFISFMFVLGGDNTEHTILFNDINVGDKIKIKGETFIVKAYSTDGNLEMIKDGTNVSYIIKIDDATKLTSHTENGVRKYISVDNFEGTVGSDYLNRIKFR